MSINISSPRFLKDKIFLTRLNLNKLINTVESRLIGFLIYWQIKSTGKSYYMKVILFKYNRVIARSRFYY